MPGMSGSFFFKTSQPPPKITSKCFAPDRHSVSCWKDSVVHKLRFYSMKNIIYQKRGETKFCIINTETG